MDPSDGNNAQQQEGNNTAMKALKEFMTKEFMMNTLKQLCSINVASPYFVYTETIDKFRSLPSTGRRDEVTLYSANVPVASDVLVSMMLDTNAWALSLSNIVCLVSSGVLPSTFQQLSKDDKTIRNILMLSADLQLPTPSVQRRSVNFLRMLKEINEETWVILDTSTNYLLPNSCLPSGHDSWKRLSGVIIKRVNNSSEVIWLEKMNGPVYQLQDTIYGALMNSERGLSAGHWVTTLIWWYKRTRSTLTKNLMNVQAENLLLKATEKMKMIFLDTVNATPDDGNWVMLSNEKVRIMKSKTDTLNHPTFKRYVGVTTFRLKAEQSEVFGSLTMQNVEIQWPETPENLTGHEEMVKCVTEDHSNCITLHWRKMFDVQHGKKAEVNEYLLQETSTDDFCSFIVAAPVTKIDVLLSGTEGDMMLCPAGFAILPDAFMSSSLITVAAQLSVNTDITEDVISAMHNYLADIKNKIAMKTGFQVTD